MNCTKCGEQLRRGQRFCEGCGAPVARACVRCGAGLEPAARFCGQCGAVVDEGAQREAVAAGREAALAHGERRQLTVLFADVVGSTSLSQRLDPEVLRQVLRRYQAICNDCIARYGGHVKQYLGDGVLAYFGYPAAHENDAERAVHAALEIIEALGAMNGVVDAALADGTPDHARIQARIGIHTGLVVIGSIGERGDHGDLAIGETPNLAARIQGEAEPDTVCISRTTRSLIGDRFTLLSLGARSLKGIAGESEVFRVTSAEATPGRLAIDGAPAPLIGRALERRHLLERWMLARRGEGQTVLLSGDAGIGKSRLLADLRDRVSADGGASRDLHGSPFFQNSALHPVIDAVERDLGSGAEREPSNRSAAFRAAMARADLVDPSSLALVGALLNIADEAGRDGVAQLAPAQRKRRTIDALISWLVAEARRRPLLVVVEDVHWMDASTRELIGVLIERVIALPILVVLAFRPEFVATWAMQAHVSAIALARLSREETLAVMLAATGGKPLPARVADEIVRRTDGVPLFVEELAKAIVASGQLVERDGAFELRDGHTAQFDVPATLRDSLTARLDRLGPAKALAQRALVLGREFDYAVLQRAFDLPEADLEEQLAALAHADIVQQSGVFARERYAFRHALIREAAYDTLLKRARQQHHARIARTYVAHFPEVVRTRPELIAFHHVESGDAVAALPWWTRAGDLAIARSGHEEAVVHFRKAIESLPLLPAAERASTELSLRVKVGPALMALAGFAAPETGENYARACELADSGDDLAERFAALFGDWLHKNTRGRFAAAARRSEDLVELSGRLHDDGYALQAHHSRWTNFVFLGEVAEGRLDTHEGMRLFDPARHWNHKFVYGGHDPGVCAHNFGAVCAWTTGHCGEARRLIETARSMALAMDHPLTLSSVLLWAPLTFHGIGDRAAAAAAAAELVVACEQHGYTQWIGGGLVVAGATAVHAGRTDDGFAAIDDGLARHRAKGPAGLSLMLAAFAADAQVAAGNRVRALDLLADAVDESDRAQMYLYRSEVDRLQVECRLAEGLIDADAALAGLDRSTSRARRQGATTLAWRSMLAAATVLASAGRDREARALLDDVVGLAVDGHDAPELDEARRRRSVLR